MKICINSIKTNMTLNCFCLLFLFVFINISTGYDYGSAKTITVRKGKVIKVISKQSKIWRMSLDVTVKQLNNAMENLLHLISAGKKTSSIGTNIPSVYLINERLQICQGVDDNGNLCLVVFNFKRNVKFNLRIEQVQKGNMYAYKGFINNQVKFEVPVKKPREYHNVTIYMSNPWHNAANATIQNFRFDNLIEKLPTTNHAFTSTKEIKTTTTSTKHNFEKSTVATNTKKSNNDSKYAMYMFIIFTAGGGLGLIVIIVKFICCCKRMKRHSNTGVKGCDDVSAQVKEEIQAGIAGYYEELPERITFQNEYQTLQTLPNDHKINASNIYECNIEGLDDSSKSYEIMTSSILGHDNETYDHYESSKPDY